MLIASYIRVSTGRKRHPKTKRRKRWAAKRVDDKPEMEMEVKKSNQKRSKAARDVFRAPFLIRA